MPKTITAPYRVQREDENGTTLLPGFHGDTFAASDAAAEAWAQEDNGFLGFPCFRVVDAVTSAVCVDPIDCRP